MVSRLTKAMGELSQADEEEQKEQQAARRKSARLSSRRGEKEELVHDSGTESDEEEMESIARYRAEHGTDPFATWKSYELFLEGGSPPALSACPPDVDTESWDSFGRESGIMTGDNDSDDGSSTPTPNRRRMKEVSFRPDSDVPNNSAEKRRHSMTVKNDDQPIAWRLRSTAEPVRTVKVAARKCPLRVLINRPPELCPTPRFTPVETPAPAPAPPAAAVQSVAPAPKRNRRNSHRPSLDFEKMVENRIESEESAFSSASSSSPKREAIVTRSQNQ